MALKKQTKFSRYNSNKTSVKEPEQKQDQMSEKTTNTEDTKPLAEQHKEFIDKAKESIISQVDDIKAEPIPNIGMSPMSSDVIMRDTVLDGIKPADLTDEPDKPLTDEPLTPPVNKFDEPKSNEPPKQPVSGDQSIGSDSPEDFTADLPPNDDAAQQTINPNPEGPENPGFKLPGNKSGELVDFGATSLNYLIRNFAGIATDVRIKKEFYSIPGAVDEVQKHNLKSVEALVLTPEEIKMLKEPLVEMLEAEGITGLTSGQKLMLAIGIILSNKIKIIIQIKINSKKLTDSFVDLINAHEARMKSYYNENVKNRTNSSPGIKETAVATNVSEIPLSHAEEIIVDETT